MKRPAKSVIGLLVLIAVIVSVRLSGIGDYLTLETLQKNRDALLALVRERYFLSVALYLATYIAAMALNLPGAAVLTVAGGYLFGTFAAIVFVNFGATIGAVLAFLAARHIMGARIQEAYTAQLTKFNEEIDRNGTRYLLTLRLIPIFPFFLVNFLSGLTRVPLATFVWTTSLGIIPGTAVYAYAGQQLGTVRSAGDILSPRVLLAFAILALFVLFPVFRGHFRKNP